MILSSCDRLSPVPPSARASRLGRTGEVTMILVATAGKVGSEASRLLAGRGDGVRVLVRHPQKAAVLAADGVDVVEGDLDVPATIDAAMHGISCVVLVSPAIPAQEVSIIDSAVRAGVGHVVKITSEA